METKKLLAWKESDFLWNKNQYTWKDVAIVKKIADALTNGSGAVVISPDTFKDLEDKINKEELDTFIKVVCKVNGLEHNEVKKRKEKPQITLSEVKKTIEEVLSIKITLSNQQFK
jgi:hypothetical protein